MMFLGTLAPINVKCEISVVVPVYGCKTCLYELHNRLQLSLKNLVERFEIIFVDDRSPDGAWDVLLDLAESDENVKVVRLSRNYGQQVAITAGLAEAVGKWVVVMDCDLQDPPEAIGLLYKKAMEGYDVVFARRTSRKQSPFRLWSAKSYFKLMSFFTKEPIDGDYGSFTILSRKVVDAFLQFQDKDRHYLFILRWLGFNSSAIDYEHGDRYAGKSAYTLSALVKHAMDGIFFQTTILLRWIVLVGLVISVFGVLFAGGLVYQYFVRNVQPGWTSLAILILLMGGFIIFSVGIAGLYIGKIFEQSKGRPLYVVDQIISRNRE